jgi:hypothetical protein
MEITIKGQTVILSDKAADYISRLGRGMRYNENFDTPDTGQWPKEWTRDFTAPNISS